MNQPESVIYHITARETWTSAEAEQSYTADSLQTEGFIHCSTLGQVMGTANLFYQGQAGLVLLQIEAARVSAEIVYEDLYASGKQFPHLYGALNLDAVSAVIDFPPNPDGSFSLPAALLT